MSRIFSLIAILSLFLAGCSNALWGSYSSPEPVAALENTPVPPSATPDNNLVAPTATITALPVLLPTPVIPDPTVAIPTANHNEPVYLYYTQGGDTLPALASRFGVDASEIQVESPLPEQGFVQPGILLLIPKRLPLTGPETPLLPDSEVVYSVSALDFDVDATVQAYGGYLTTTAARVETASLGIMSGGQSIRRVALENSINPRILLALLEYQSGWVRSQPLNAAQEDYPLGHQDYMSKGLFKQMGWAVQQLSIGYYGWRNGKVTELTFKDGVTIRIAPTLNAGSVAVQYFLAQNRTYNEWLAAIDPQNGFPALYREMFGDPELRARLIEPIIPPGLQQPEFSLPFEPGFVWAYTGGPHAAWNKEGALAAIDFAPGSALSGCNPSDYWVVAMTSGRVVRSETGLVVLDLDDDGNEQTGWNIIYLHIASEGRARLGAQLQPGDRIGHPSCEGGTSTGTHVHIARKYNGEWVLADGPLPLVMDGWRVVNGAEPYQGQLLRGEEIREACTCSSIESQLTREE